MDKWLKRPVSHLDPGGRSEETAEKRKKEAKSKPRQYNDKYIVYGFTSTTSSELPQPQCFFCGEMLSNSAMKPAHLQRHQSTKHPSKVGRTQEYFKRKLTEFKAGQNTIIKATSVSNKALLVAQSKNPHSIVEQLILPAVTRMAEIMIDKKAAETFKKVPLSNNTVARRIDDMSLDIVGQVVNKIKQAGHFALQLDEMTDVSGEAQLLAFVRYKDVSVSDIKEHILFCKRLPGQTTGEKMFQVIDSFFKEHEIQWNQCSHICTDGATAMTGSVKGLFGQVKKVNPKIKWMHCIIRREALASKRMSPDLSAVMDDAVKIINFIQSRPLNHRLFETLCHESGAQHDHLLLHTDVRWLSRGKTLLRLYELRSEVCEFLKEQLHPLAAGFEDANWPFPLLHAHLLTSAAIRAPVIKLVEEHLSKLNTDFNQYFQHIDKKSESLDWVRDPFTTTESSNKLPARLQEQLWDVSSDRGLKVAHREKTLTEFWCDVEREYPELGKHALVELLPFGSTYMCEVTFSALTHIKTNKRNRLNVENSLIAAVSTLSPDVAKLMKDKQAQVSH
ncbi:hypothetical protein ACEWY4_002285 [Coilia grayii]|uniref:C2H2-type domain-containing protein n=1 Tax=Coilia grayii TaxID=363190 RepID=A0ABD1KVB9_9TELE